MTQATRHRSDSPTKTCTRDGCDRPLRARGFCNTHYKQMRGTSWAYKQVSVACDWCGVTTMKTKTRRYSKRFCTWTCRDEWQRWNVRSLSCPVPDTHPSRSTAVPTDHPSRVAPAPPPAPRFHAGRCRECAQPYIIASACVSASRYCSRTCARRTAKRARRAREHGASGTYTWDGFTRLALSLGNACSYCGVTGVPLDPDHVRALSRGGHNGLTNILPACRSCNSRKGDRSLGEWIRTMRRLGFPPFDVHHFTHLTAHVWFADAA